MGSTPLSPYEAIQRLSAGHKVYVLHLDAECEVRVIDGELHFLAQSGWARLHNPFDRTYYRPEKQGLLPSKYRITKADGSPLDPGKYFVLRYDQADEWGNACRIALWCLASALSFSEEFDLLAEDLRRAVRDTIGDSSVMDWFDSWVLSISPGDRAFDGE